MAYNWRRIRSGIINTFRNNGYSVDVQYENGPDIYPTYDITVYSNDEEVYDLIDDIIDEYDLSENEQDWGDGWVSWELYDENY